MRSKDKTYDMRVAAYRMAVLAGSLVMAFVVVLAATTASASAHPAGMHEPAAASETHAKAGYITTVDTCCHKAGNCVVQFVQFSPATDPLDGSLSLLQRSFAVERHASIPSATDPPPPRA